MKNMRNPEFRTLPKSANTLSITQPMDLSDAGFVGEYSHCINSGRLNLFSAYIICQNNHVIIQEIDPAKKILIPYRQFSLTETWICISAEIHPQTKTIYIICEFKPLVE